jgi:WD40 repeat protein
MWTGAWPYPVEHHYFIIRDRAIRAGAHEFSADQYRGEESLEAPVRGLSVSACGQLQLNNLPGLLVSPKQVTELSFSADGSRLFSRHDHQGLGALVASPRSFLWDIKAKKRLSIGHTDTSNGPIAESAAFSPDGNLLAVGDHLGMVRVYASENGKMVRELKTDSRWIRGLSFSEDSSLLAAAAESRMERDGPNQNVRTGSVTVWDTKSWQPKHTIHEPRAGVQYAAFPPAARQVAAVTELDAFRLWEIETGDQVFKSDVRLRVTGPLLTRCVAPSADGRFLASAGDVVQSPDKGGYLTIVDLQSPEKPLIATELSFQVHSLAIAGNGAAAAA